MNRRNLARAIALLEAGDWKAAHEIVQRDEDSPLYCWAHGIAHLMEGDAPNARYWYREAKRPFPKRVSVREELAALRRQLPGINPGGSA